MTRNSNSVTQTDWLKATVFSVPRHFWSKETDAKNHIKFTKPLTSVRQIESKQKNLKTREFFWKVENRFLQVNLFQKLSFLHQLTRNTYDKRLFIEFPRKIQVQDMLCTKIVLFFLFWHSNNICTQHVLNLYFTCTEVVNQWAICRHIVG